MVLAPVAQDIFRFLYQKYRSERTRPVHKVLLRQETNAPKAAAIAVTPQPSPASYGD